MKQGLEEFDTNVASEMQKLFEDRARAYESDCRALDSALARQQEAMKNYDWYMRQYIQELYRRYDTETVYNE